MIETAPNNDRSRRGAGQSPLDCKNGTMDDDDNVKPTNTAEESFHDEEDLSKKTTIIKPVETYDSEAAAHVEQYDEEDWSSASLSSFGTYCRIAFVLGVIMFAALTLVLVLTLQKEEEGESRTVVPPPLDARFENPQTVAWRPLGRPITSSNSSQTNVIFSADGQSLLVSFSLNMAYLYNWAESDDAWQSTFEFSSVDIPNLATTMALSPNGERVALGTPRSVYVYGRVSVENLDPSSAVQYTWIPEVHPIRMEDETLQIASLDWNYDGTLLAAGTPHHQNRTGQIFLYNTPERTEWRLHALVRGTRGQDSVGSRLDLSDNGQVLVDGTFWANTENGLASGQVLTWQGDGFLESLPPLLGDAPMDVFGDIVALSADGHVLAVTSPLCNQTGAVLVYQQHEEQESMWAWQLRGSVSNIQATGVCLSADGNLLTVAAMGAVRVYQWDSQQSMWQPVGEPIRGDEQSFGTAVSCSDDGHSVAIASSKGVVRVFHAVVEE